MAPWGPSSKQLPSTSSTLGTAVSLSLLKEEGWLLENLAAGSEPVIFLDDQKKIQKDPKSSWETRC
jgi:hypothetical protein